jgi:hypothetical protein
MAAIDEVISTYLTDCEVEDRTANPNRNRSRFNLVAIAGKPPSRMLSGVLTSAT